MRSSGWLREAHGLDEELFEVRMVGEFEVLDVAGQRSAAPRIVHENVRSGVAREDRIEPFGPLHHLGHVEQAEQGVPAALVQLSLQRLSGRFTDVGDNDSGRAFFGEEPARRLADPRGSPRKLGLL